MSLEATVWAWEGRRAGLLPGKIAGDVLCALCERANRVTWRTQPTSAATLASWTGWDRVAVQRALRRLVDCRAVAIAVPGGPYRGAVYLVDPDETRLLSAAVSTLHTAAHTAALTAAHTAARSSQLPGTGNREPPPQPPNVGEALDLAASGVMVAERHAGKRIAQPKPYRRAVAERLRDEYGPALEAADPSTPASCLAWSVILDAEPMRAASRPAGPRCARCGATDAVPNGKCPQRECPYRDSARTVAEYLRANRVDRLVADFLELAPP